MLRWFHFCTVVTVYGFFINTFCSYRCLLIWLFIDKEGNGFQYIKRIEKIQDLLIFLFWLDFNKTYKLTLSHQLKKINESFKILSLSVNSYKKGCLGEIAPFFYLCSIIFFIFFDLFKKAEFINQPKRIIFPFFQYPIRWGKVHINYKYSMWKITQWKLISTEYKKYV